MQTGKKEVQLSLFTYDITLIIRDLKDTPEHS